MKYPLFIFLSFLLPSLAFAFPEMTRHGYVNCTACHLSPSGGGILVPYGRELSKELLSTWSKEGEQNFAYCALTPPEKVLVSGYVRGLELYTSDQNATETKRILMQADLEAAYNADKWVVDGTIGQQTYYDSNGNEEHKLYSRRHYVQAKITDQQNLRFGRFQNSYGIGDPNHELFVRDGLGFGEGTETYNLEYSYLGESLSAYVSAIFGNFHDYYSFNQEKGMSATGSYYFLDKDKLGLSYYYGDTKDATRNLIGPWTILSLTDKLYLESELDFQFSKPKADAEKQSGYVTTNKLAYEAHKGVIPFGVWEFTRLNLSDDASKKQSFGAGLQFLPRPHFEFIVEWQKIRTYSAGKNYTDFAWIMANFYL